MENENILKTIIRRHLPDRETIIRYNKGRLSLIIEVQGMNGKERETIQNRLSKELSALDDVRQVTIGFTQDRRANSTLLKQEALKQESKGKDKEPIPPQNTPSSKGQKKRTVENERGAPPASPPPRSWPPIIAIASGKGGVGKSTVAANLALSLQHLGVKVGMIDADIYGPSQTKLLAAEGLKPDTHKKKLIPVQGVNAIKLLSMGQIVPPGRAVSWRGIMATKALGQLIDAQWGDTELLIADMPPGTGDIQLSMIQHYRPIGAIIISSPQDLALIDASRAIDQFNSAKVPIIGLVENMSGYACPSCGDISDPFGAGGVIAAAKQLSLPFLGKIPLNIAIRLHSDAGNPPTAHKAAHRNAQEHKEDSISQRTDDYDQTGKDNKDITQPFFAIAKRVNSWLEHKQR